MVFYNKRNIDLIEILDWLHISVHSHRKDTFEKIKKQILKLCIQYKIIKKKF